MCVYFHIYTSGVVERPIRTCRVKSCGGVDILCEVKNEQFLQMLAEDVHEEANTLKRNISDKPPQHESVESGMCVSIKFTLYIVSAELSCLICMVPQVCQILSQFSVKHITRTCIHLYIYHRKRWQAPT